LLLNDFATAPHEANDLTMRFTQLKCNPRRICHSAKKLQPSSSTKIASAGIDNDVGLDLLRQPLHVQLMHQKFCLNSRMLWIAQMSLALRAA
jgi:hypothetical protein